ncbi:MAG: hypothetical protein JXX14_24000 [Deltaproteobacteria bacterium]|nr:hypothetical protein [Deltaproteobacteria bacterium]
MVFSRAKSHEQAEQWDLAFWQSLSPAERLSAHVAILRDVALVQQAHINHQENTDGSSQ